MKFIRKILLLTLSVLLLLPLIPAKTYGQDYIPKRRIVTLIYDDSGSMWEGLDKKNNPVPIDNWKYANYSLQSLIGLLDSDDLLYVIPMSTPTESKSISLGENSRQDQINKIQKWTGQSGTPIETIQTAIKQMNGLTTEFPDAEYWMIVLTDGIFAELDQYAKGNSLAKVTASRNATEKSLTELTQNLRNNGIAFNSALITIESYLASSQKEIMGDFKKLWVTSTNGSVIESDNEESIVESINKVAALMTNRDPDETKIFDLHASFTERGVTLKSPFPLRRITVLNQSRDESSRLEIKEVSFNGQERKEGIEGPFLIDSPLDPHKLTPPIKGSITHIKQGKLGEVVPEGEYELHFATDITEEQKRNLRFLAEPAVDFNIKINKVDQDGSLTADETTFFPKSKMLLEVELIQSESKKPISLDGVNKEIFKINAIVNDKNVNLTWDDKRKTFTGHFELQEEETSVKVSAQIEGLYQKEKTQSIHVSPIRKLELKRADQSPWTVKVDRLHEGKPIEIIPFVNGMEMTEEELQEIFSTITVISSGYRMEYGLNRENNHIYIKPKKRTSILVTATGEIPVHVTLKGKYPNEYADLDFSIKVLDIPWYIKFWQFLIIGFIFILLAVYIIGIIVKPRFAKDRISLSYQYISLVNGQKVYRGQPSTENFNTNIFERWLIPYKAEQKSIQGILFKAAKKPDKVILSKESQTANMIVAGEELSEDSGKREIQLFSNDEIRVESHSSIENYIFKTS